LARVCALSACLAELESLETVDFPLSCAKGPAFEVVENPNKIKVETTSNDLNMVVSSTAYAVFNAPYGVLISRPDYMPNNR
jgi:hypothetical protein